MLCVYQLLTGARLGEVLTSRKEDCDLQRGTWTKPSHQTKQKRTEHLPLSAQVLALIASIIEISEPHCCFLFPGNKLGQPLHEIQKFWINLMRKAGITNYRLHGNQHTYASHLFSSGLSLEIIGRMLGTQQRPQPNATLILPMIRCVHPQTDLDRRSTVSSEKEKRTSFLFGLEHDAYFTQAGSQYLPAIGLS
jgi:Phage integrase family